MPDKSNFLQLLGQSRRFTFINYEKSYFIVMFYYVIREYGVC